MKDNKFQLYLASSTLLDDSDIDALVQIAKPRFLEKGAYLIRESQIVDEIGFVVDGFLHSYYLDHNQEEKTYCLVFPSEFVTAYSSFLTGQHSNIYVRALNQVSLNVISKVDLLRLMETRPNLKNMFHSLTEAYLVKLENRFFQFQKDYAKTRYNELLNEHPEFIRHIPLKLLASYLGITPRHLSRIRRILD
ncbi:Crp/Fnr family transcriptional regulator [Flagellimonas lutimaris]|nr:Crp/Fnr family transcriptional regulator [Allomuricauda lutimaris]